MVHQLKMSYNSRLMVIVSHFFNHEGNSILKIFSSNTMTCLLLKLQTVLTLIRAVDNI